MIPIGCEGEIAVRLMLERSVAEEAGLNVKRGPELLIRRFTHVLNFGFWDFVPVEGQQLVGETIEQAFVRTVQASVGVQPLRFGLVRPVGELEDSDPLLKHPIVHCDRWKGEVLPWREGEPSSLRVGSQKTQAVSDGSIELSSQMWVDQSFLDWYPLPTTARRAVSIKNKVRFPYVEC